MVRGVSGIQKLHYLDQKSNRVFLLVVYRLQQSSPIAVVLTRGMFKQMSKCLDK
jgi:hypothetical protein